MRSKPKPAPSTNGRAADTDVLTLKEAAVYLRVTAEEVFHKVETDDLPARQFGAEWRFSKVALQEWLSKPAKKRGLSKHFGAAKDDPYLEDMLRDIYARRGRPETEEA